MKRSFQVGLSFGTTSGIITTLALMIGLYSGTNSRLAVIGGVLTIAIADSLSDSMGIHVTQESENRHTDKEIWESTFCTFICKFIIASSFIVPVLLFELKNAIYIGIIWGLLLLSLLSYYISRIRRTKAWKVVTEHIVIAIFVIILSYYVGYWINILFG